MPLTLIITLQLNVLVQSHAARTPVTMEAPVWQLPPTNKARTHVTVHPGTLGPTVLNVSTYLYTSPI